MKAPKLKSEHLHRRALVYVRQSTQAQVLGNLESQRRQYELAELAREMGFSQVDVIDYDLGRSGAGGVERPGFDRLFVELATREVGAGSAQPAHRSGGGASSAGGAPGGVADGADGSAGGRGACPQPDRQGGGS